ncbi:unannotated protein [freshwater metagenome]|uniref:Unannotated protein n=1 Tax=freshwater metagenome TaxID=449393 RepID=A0A6J7PXZ3_9ZZZZ
MQQRGHLIGQRSLRSPLFRFCSVFGKQTLQFVERLQREHPQVRTDHLVVALHPELAELVRGGALWVEPHRSPSGLAELAAVALEHQRMGDCERLLAKAPSDQLRSGNDIAPLVAGSGLELHPVGFVQMPEIVGLEQHVAELGVRDAVLALDPAAHGVLGGHLVHREVFANVAQELEHRH